MLLKNLLLASGILMFIIFVIAKNGLLVNEQISFIFSSEYLFYMSVFLVFMGYYLSTVDARKKPR